MTYFFDIHCFRNLMEFFLIALFIIFMEWVLLELISFVLVFLNSSFKIINQCLLNQTGTNHQFVLVVLTSSYVLKTMTNHVCNQSHNFEVSIWGPDLLESKVGLDIVTQILRWRQNTSKGFERGGSDSKKTRTQREGFECGGLDSNKSKHKRRRFLNVMVAYNFQSFCF
jgi:hypothetical protein